MLFFKLPDRCVYLKYCAGAFLLLNIVSAPSQYNISIIPFMLGLYLTVKVRYESACKKQKHKFLIWYTKFSLYLSSCCMAIGYS